MKKILAIATALVLIMTSFVSVSAKIDVYESGIYRDRFEDYIMAKAGEWSRMMYYEIYYHYDNPEDSGTDTVPSYVLTFASDGPGKPLEPLYIIGTDYGIRMYSDYTPNSLGFFIYIPAEDKIYTLEEAYDQGIEGIDEAFYYLGEHCYFRGDIDCNKEINIKDATMIQKSLAGFSLSFNHNFSDFRMVGFDIMDFNKDGSVDVKDATAIQKHIVGLAF